jgi:zinc transport system ATP-binding protein
MIVEVAAAQAGYEGRQVLRGVDLCLKAGEAVALLGANGSGKSTLVRAALGLVPLSGGSAALFGTPLARFKQWRRIGYVPQRLGAGGGVPATVTEVVAVGRLAMRRIPWPATKTDHRIVNESIGAVGLSERAGDSVATLSGGQQQRVLIARALTAQPELLVMDEPTAGVDAANQELLSTLLSQHLRQGGAILLVAHELGPLAPLIDRAVVLSNGNVVHNGPVPTTGDTAGDHAHGAITQPGLWSVA